MVIEIPQSCTKPHTYCTAELLCDKTTYIVISLINWFYGCFWLRKAIFNTVTPTPNQNHIDTSLEKVTLNHLHKGFSVQKASNMRHAEILSWDLIVMSVLTEWVHNAMPQLWNYTTPHSPTDINPVKYCSELSTYKSIYIVVCNGHTQKNTAMPQIYHYRRVSYNMVLYQQNNAYKTRADSRLAASQWETSLQSNGISHWQGTKPRISPANQLSSYWSIYALCCAMGMERKQWCHKFITSQVSYRVVPYNTIFCIQHCCEAIKVFTHCCAHWVYTEKHSHATGLSS